MTQLERELPPFSIAQEMREASRGSFPLSPGVMTGHYATSKLYWYFRQDILAKESVAGVFGETDPQPLALELPEGHQNVNLVSLNETVWKDFLEKAFGSRPQVDYAAEIDVLIASNASADFKYFERRLKGERSRIAGDGPPAPSLLRSFLYEDGFPEKNEFFSWMFTQMRAGVLCTLQKGTKQSGSLGDLVNTWNKYLPDTPFIPEGY